MISCLVGQLSLAACPRNGTVLVRDEAPMRSGLVSGHPSGIAAAEQLLLEGCKRRMKEEDKRTDERSKREA